MTNTDGNIKRKKKTEDVSKYVRKREKVKKKKATGDIKERKVIMENRKKKAQKNG